MSEDGADFAIHVVQPLQHTVHHCVPGLLT